MNEKNQTQAIAGPRPVQRDAGPQSRSEREKEIKALEAEEAQLFASRGYGGYIDSDKLDELRVKRTALESSNNP